MTGYETDDIIEKLFDSFGKISRRIRRKVEKSNLVFNSVDALYYKLHRTSLDRGGSYIDSPEWLKNKKATINPKSKKNDKIF